MAPAMPPATGSGTDGMGVGTVAGTEGKLENTDTGVTVEREDG